MKIIQIEIWINDGNKVKDEVQSYLQVSLASSFHSDFFPKILLCNLQLAASSDVYMQRRICS